MHIGSSKKQGLLSQHQVRRGYGSLSDADDHDHDPPEVGITNKFACKHIANIMRNRCQSFNTRGRHFQSMNYCAIVLISYI